MKISADLRGKKALVTGAAAGIGLATVEALASSGAAVAMNDLASNPRLNAEVERLRGLGCNVIAAPRTRIAWCAPPSRPWAASTGW